ncbi:MAG: ATP-binding protein [Corynebacterium sp.]|uniref:AAA family ATPase n=1 Tax=Corynebacterium sp. TaxID=1720 RepID=UPI0026DBBD15|nr:ATP-binding protein [Corynebacterium sp.]MDO5098700.1 ATP-binding protein [Corynebacterium sp.]
MILEFRVSNYSSYNEEAVLSMIATREQAHGERLAVINKHHARRVNPIAGIYGANASGKTNEITAILEWKNLILKPQLGSIGDRHFKLAQLGKTRPVAFQMHFLHDETVFIHGIKIVRGRVSEEYLYKTSGKTHTLIFDRSEDGVELSHDNDQVLSLIQKNLAPSETLAFRLGETLRGEEGYEDFCAPFKFAQRLLFVSPRAQGITVPLYEDKSLANLNETLAALDIGVLRLDIEDTNIDQSDFSPSEIDEIIGSDRNSSALISDGNSLFQIRGGDDAVSIKKICFIHQGVDGEYKLEWGEQSEGTRKVFSILPLLWTSVHSQKAPPIVLIDEIDQSLHTSLAEQFLRAFLHLCTENTRSQLIFTAHDLMLMNLDYLRRDEIWICEKSPDGSSELIRLTEYAGIRNDKDIRKSYLLGRFGGVPEVNSRQLLDSLAGKAAG